jgi:hypothetical protein
VKDALLRDDGADQEGDEQDDGHCLPGDAVELMYGRGETVVARAHDHTHERRADGAEHLGEDHEVAAEVGAGAADGGKEGDDRVPGLRLRGRLAVDAVHLLKETAVMLGKSDNHRLASRRRPLPGQALQQPGAERVELAYARHVDRHVLGLGRLAAHAVDERFELARVVRGPRPPRGKLEPFPDQFVCQQSLTHRSRSLASIRHKPRRPTRLANNSGLRVAVN